MKYIVIPILVGITTQCIKFIIETIKTKKINIIRLFDGMGGMPSTHSALVSSLSTIIYLNYVAAKIKLFYSQCTPLFFGQIQIGFFRGSGKTSKLNVNL